MLPKERTKPQRILSQHLRLFHLRIEGVSEATPVGAAIGFAGRWAQNSWDGRGLQSPQRPAKTIASI